MKEPGEAFDLEERNEAIDDGDEPQGELRFPYPLQTTNILTRTDANLKNNSGNREHNLNLIEGGDESEEESRLIKAMRRAQQTTKDFFGVETGKKVSRSVNHWNERTFKLLNKDSLMGKLNHEKMTKYMTDMKENVDHDSSSPLLYYQLSNGDVIRTEPKKNAMIIAVDSLKKTLSARSSDAATDQVDTISGENQPGIWDAFNCDGDRKFGIGFCDKFFDK